MAIKIEFLSGIVRFLRGTKDMEEALDDVADSLDDVAQDAKKAGDKTGDAISDGAKDAEQSVERLERSFKDMADQARRSTGDASDAMKRDMDSGTDAAKRDLGELKDEALANASETFSSFDGSITSLADGIQGTLGGVISNIGPAGALAGAAAAIGVGMLTAEFERSQERAAELREQAAELARQIIEAGGNIRDVPMVETLQDWSLELSGTSEAWDIFGDKSQTNLDAMRGAAKSAGVDLADMISSLSGSDPEQAVEILDKLNKKLEEQQAGLRNLSGARAGGTARADEYRTEIAALEDGIKVLEERSGVTKEGIEDARSLTTAMAEQAAQEEANAAATQLRTDAANALQSALDEGISAWSEYYNAETGATDPTAYMTAMQTRIDATNSFNENVRTLADTTGLTMEEAQAVLDQGVDFAPMLASIVGGGEESMAQYAALVQQIVGGGQEIANGSPLTIGTKADTTQANTDLEAAAVDRTSGVEAVPDTKAAAQDLDATANKRRTATIRAQASTGTASAALGYAARNRTATLTLVLDKEQAERDLTEFQNRYRETTVNIKTRGGKEVP